MAPFRVNKLSKSTVVTAARLLHDHQMPQSNPKSLLPPVNASVFLCYRNLKDKSFRSVVNVLKNALGKTLGRHFAFPGEMVAGDAELLCCNHGVDFVEARAGVDLRDLDFYNPDESIQGRLVPGLGDGVLAAQVTQLSCGGVVVGCTFNHQVIDGYSASMFCRSWAEMARSTPPSNLPSFHPSIRKSNPSISNLNHFPVSRSSAGGKSTCISRIYSVSAEQINRLELFANYGNHSYLKPKRTKLEALSAYLWKLIATGTNSGENYCRLGLAINNSILKYSVLFGEKKTEKLRKMALNSIADEIHDFVYASDEIDFVEARRSNLAVVVMPENGFPVRKMDFGWGAPVFGSYHVHDQWPEQSGYVIPMASPSENGDMIMYIHLPKHHIDVIEKAGGHVFKPFHLNF